MGMDSISMWLEWRNLSKNEKSPLRPVRIFQALSPMGEGFAEYLIRQKETYLIRRVLPTGKPPRFC
jgi:hypothetical protein